MNLQILGDYCRAALKSHPHKKSEIMDIYEYARDEVSDGGSEDHECSNAYSDLKELLG